MHHYRCYFLNADGYIVDFQELTKCRDDVAVRLRAIALLDERPQYKGVTVWERSRKIFEKIPQKASLPDTADVTSGVR